MKKEEKRQVAEQERFANGDAAAGEAKSPEGDGKACDNVAEETPAQAAGTAKMADDAAEWRDKYVRLSAEFDNYRKRTLREKMELVSSAGEDVIKSLLPVLDDFERAIKAIEKSEGCDTLLEGVVLIAGKLKETLRSKGLAEIEAMGKVLDTDLHEAVAKVPAGKGDKGKVVDVVQRGYKLNDKVIRHAKVVVGE